MQLVLLKNSIEDVPREVHDGVSGGHLVVNKYLAELFELVLLILKKDLKLQRANVVRTSLKSDQSNKYVPDTLDYFRKLSGAYVLSNQK